MKIHKKFDHHLPGVFFLGEKGDIDIRFNVCNIKAGDQFPDDPVHYHKTRTTYFYTIEGSVKIEVEGENILVTPEIMLEVPPMAKYRTHEVGKEGCKLIVVGSHNDVDVVRIYR